MHKGEAEKEVENCIMDTLAFLDTHACVNNPY